MEIQVLAKFHLKITIIYEARFTNLILPQIWSIFGFSLAQLLSRIHKFERISNFSDLNHGNTSSDRVSTQNYRNWWSYCQKVNFATTLAHIWIFFRPHFVQNSQLLKKLLNFADLNYGNTSTDRVSTQNYINWCSYCQKGNFATNLAIYGPSLAKFCPK